MALFIPIPGFIPFAVKLRLELNNVKREAARVKEEMNRRESLVKELMDNEVRLGRPTQLQHPLHEPKSAGGCLRCNGSEFIASVVRNKASISVSLDSVSNRIEHYHMK